MRILILLLCPTPSLAPHGKLGLKDELIVSDIYYV